MKTIWVCTKHNKEQIVSQVFPLDQFEVHHIDFDTDSLGTFTPEVKRISSQSQTALIKAEKALELSNCDIGIGSEWSFQSLYFGIQTLWVECVSMKIRQSKQIIVWMASQPIQHALSLQLDELPDKKIASIIQSELKQWYAFCIQWSNQSVWHKLKYLITWRRGADIVKWLNNYNQILIHIEKAFSLWYKNITIEHDFRAHHHPERQTLIKKACEDLYQKFTTHCPQCSAIGRWVKEKEYGLPCKVCGTESKDRKSLVYICDECGLRYSEPRIDKQYTDPARCSICNP